jgi:hypothetical protein
MCWAHACAIDVSGVIATSLSAAPDVIAGITAVITSPEAMGMMLPDASSAYLPPVICSITDPA